MPPRPPRPPQRPPAQQPPPKEEPPREIIRDTFQKFKKDPRIDTSILKEQRQQQSNVSPERAKLLSAAADAIAQLSQEFGLPSFLSSYKQVQQISWALLIQDEPGPTTSNDTPNTHFDIIFSNKGETYGRKIIDNKLFFEKAFPQHKTWAYDDFIDHHMNHATDAERFVLLNSQVLSLDLNFTSLVDQQITRLIFERPLSPEFEKALALRRQTMLAKYPNFDFPDTHEGWNDFLLLIRSTQLIYGRVYPQLRQRSISVVLASLTSLTIFSPDQLQRILEVKSKPSAKRNIFS